MKDSVNRTIKEQLAQIQYERACFAAFNDRLDKVTTQEQYDSLKAKLDNFIAQPENQRKCPSGVLPNQCPKPTGAKDEKPCAVEGQPSPYEQSYCKDNPNADSCKNLQSSITVRKKRNKTSLTDATEVAVAALIGNETRLALADLDEKIAIPANLAIKRSKVLQVA